MERWGIVFKGGFIARLGIKNKSLDGGAEGCRFGQKFNQISIGSFEKERGRRK